MNKEAYTTMKVALVNISSAATNTTHEQMRVARDALTTVAELEDSETIAPGEPGFHGDDDLNEELPTRQADACTADGECESCQ